MSDYISPEHLAQGLAENLGAWIKDEFYSTATVLGLDVGLEGIGVCVRQGREIIYARTWQYDVPETARLEGRRQKRAWRHCRANRKTRLVRLKVLFEKHGLHWHDDRDPELLNSDPYLLRYRAVKEDGTGLASVKAVSIALRHCVTHRGYEYDYYNDEGAFPWGDATEFKKVLKELDGIWLAPADAEKARLQAISFEWSEAQLAEFNAAVARRIGGEEKLEARLAEHAKANKNHRRTRAKGEAFPRSVVWEHLQKIARRHAHLIQDIEGFLSALGSHPKRGGAKEAAIFFYHRKTPAEMKAHFDKKRARCIYAPWLGLPDAFVGTGDDLAIRKFRLLEFASTREVELDVKSTKARIRVPLGPDLTAELIDWISSHPSARAQKDCSEITVQLRETLEKKHNAKVTSLKGSELNEWFFKVLRDLLAPNLANRSRNAGMSVAVAEKLFTLATADGYTREAINAALSQCRAEEDGMPASIYNFRRKPRLDAYGLYPQVEFLLGQRVKKARSRGGKPRGTLAHPGKLQRLFEQLSPKLGGKLRPDYCIVETARDLPRNLQQKKERENTIKENEERRRKLFAQYGLRDDGNRRTRTRLELYHQQNGVCPFTGDALPQPGTTEFLNLDVEHLFPQSADGLTVDENLVLTSARVNRELKKDRTPRAYAKAQGIAFESILAFTAAMRWSKAKREIFAWENSETIPPFCNTTRTAQLARQLQSGIAEWMGISDPEVAAAQIGTPSGFLTAACRRAWKMPEKDRIELTHHLVDAAVLAHIPPQIGQNYLHPSSIFIPKILPGESGPRTVLDVLPLGPSESHIAALVARDATICPVERHRSGSPHRSQHDQTLLGVFPGNEGGERQLRYRKELTREDSKLDDTSLEQRLSAMGIHVSLRPSRDELNRWLTEDGSPSELRLRDGSQIRAIYEDSDKFKTPFGFTCRLNADGNWQGIRIFREKFDALEVWRDFDPKGRPCFITQRRPSRPALRALLSLGFNWFRLVSRRAEWPFAADNPHVAQIVDTLRRLRSEANAWKRLLRRQTAQTVLRSLIELGFDADGKLPETRWREFQLAIWGKLPTSQARVALVRDSEGKVGPAILRKGDALLLKITVGGDIADKPELAAFRRWYRVSAIKADGKVEMKMLLEKPSKEADGKRARRSDDGLRQTLEKSAPADLAKILNLPPLHDTPPRPASGRSRPAHPERETDFRLE